MSYIYHVNNGQLNHNLDVQTSVTFNVTGNKAIFLEKPTDYSDPVSGDFISAIVSGDSTVYVPQLTSNATATGYVVFQRGDHTSSKYELSNSAAGFIPLAPGSTNPAFPLSLKNNVFYNKSTSTVTLKISNKEEQVATLSTSAFYDGLNLTNITIDTAVYSYDGSASGGAAGTLPKGAVIYITTAADNSSISLANDFDANVYVFNQVLVSPTAQKQ